MKTVTTANLKTKPTSKMSSRDILVIICATLALPLLTLLPFAIRANTTFFSVGSSLLGWAKNGTAIESPQQLSIGWNAPSNLQTISMLSVMITVLVAIGVLAYARSRTNRVGLRRFAQLHLIITLAVIAVTAFTYNGMRNRSDAMPLSIQSGRTYVMQSTNNGMTTTRCGSATLDKNTSSFSDTKSCHDAIKPVRQTFGYGIRPTYFVLEAMLFIIAPLLNWYRFAISSRYVSGQKKEALFQ